jgi:hypothetical protein
MIKTIILTSKIVKRMSENVTKQLGVVVIVRELIEVKSTDGG